MQIKELNNELWTFRRFITMETRNWREVPEFERSDCDVDIFNDGVDWFLLNYVAGSVSVFINVGF